MLVIPTGYWTSARGDGRPAPHLGRRKKTNCFWTWSLDHVFGSEAPLAAAFEILPFLASVVLLIWLLRPWNKYAAAALVPYALRVSFAAVLNWTIAIQN